MRKRFRIAVIGAGASGAAFLFGLLQNLRHEAYLASYIEIIVFEKNSKAGPGSAYSDVLNLVNDTMNLQTNEVFRDERDLFREWLQKQPNERLESLGYIEMLEHQAPYLLQTYREGNVQLGETLAGRSHDINPRIAVGCFLSDLFQETYLALRDLGVKITVQISVPVVDIQKTKKQDFYLSYGRNHIVTEKFDAICLFTGYKEFPISKDRKGLFFSGFPAQKIVEEADALNPIAVFGTGVFGAEVAVKFNAGEFYRDEENAELKFLPHSPHFKVTMFSSSGFLPSVKGYTTEYKPRYLTKSAIEKLIANNNNYLPLDDLVDLFKYEISISAPVFVDKIKGWEGFKLEDICHYLEVDREALGCRDRLARDISYAKYSRDISNLLPIPWQDPLMLMFVFCDEYLYALSAEDRMRFDDLSSIFLKEFELIPLHIAERIIAMMDSGALEIVKVKNIDVSIDDEYSRGVTVSYVDKKDNLVKTHFSTFVQAASGRFKFFDNDTNSLINILKRRGLASNGLLKFYSTDEGLKFFNKQAEKLRLPTMQKILVKQEQEITEFWLDVGGVHIDETGRILSETQIGKSIDKDHRVFGNLPYKNGLFPVGGGLTIGKVMTRKIANCIMQLVRNEFNKLPDECDKGTML